MNAEVKSGNVTHYLHQTKLQGFGCHAGMNCDPESIKHCLHCVWLAQESKYKPYLTRKPFKGLISLDFLAVPLSKIELHE